MQIISHLRPKWISPILDPPGHRVGIGVSFDCPMCNNRMNERGRVEIYIKNPLDELPPPHPAATTAQISMTVKGALEGVTLIPLNGNYIQGSRCHHKLTVRGGVVSYWNGRPFA